MNSTATAAPTATNAPATLPRVTIADEINAEHRACLESASTALDHAMRCGDLLAEAKSTLSHGQWRQWLAENFTGSARTARLYMQLSGRRSELEAKRQRDTVLSIAEARRLIAGPASPARDFDGFFPPELAAIFDADLNGPFCPDDFTNGPGIQWIETKMIHQAKLPAVAAWALTTEIETEIPLLRVVPWDELVESLQIIAPYLKGKMGFDFANATPHHVGILDVCLSRMAGGLLVELEHRTKLETDKQYETERAAALEQFSAAVDARIAELGAAA